jgi:GT2 family glycosyltransferase
MYCEDVDLSWKFWLSGWKCIYVPDAVVSHFTQDVLPGKKRTAENYFSFRNSLFLFYRFGCWHKKRVLYNFLLSRSLYGNYSFRSRLLYAFAFVDHIRYIPYLYSSRRYLIPFGWYGNPIPSTAASAWVILIADRFDPFGYAGRPN